MLFIVYSFSKNALIMLRRIPDTNKIMGNTSCGNPKAFWKKNASLLVDNSLSIESD